MPQELTDILKKHLKAKLGYDDQALETTVEINANEFRRGMQSKIKSHADEVLKHQMAMTEAERMYREAVDFSDDYHVKYFMTAQGTVGYIILGEKKLGFSSKQYE